ncbi:hypothetical protein BCR34DRAFT_615377 [Clohesyomyces aquaticus]|uniref:Fe2OG dioxygenase domain-containing protein n=1 Tax=Clohesyomyces aquaticus TaxID=1231657 RepID=A0A1Y1ZIT3_9PLEO|nr:hypothetical protein BCR34DRAFT_615377 [Clohesyomyces aquaticus]
MVKATSPVPRPSTLRWDTPSGTLQYTHNTRSLQHISKLVFPLSETGPNAKATLLKLARDCQPTSFGYKGKDVLNESIRKATKLDRSEFSTDFCPCELGIVDTITQGLLPNALDAVKVHGGKAELYKLNAPSGFFKAHVDTPRSAEQFGSLVVSFPRDHQGGQAIAEFYSDCEHEVLEVTEGHYITLTYNLYHTLGVGDLAVNSPVMDVKSLPMYEKVKAALAQSVLMENGGYRGVYCHHAYAHSTEGGIKSLPAVLKGLDDDSGTDSTTQKGKSVVGRLGRLVISDAGGWGDESRQEINEGFGGKYVKVNWLTRPVEGEIGYIYMAYGNQAEVGWIYTYPAILV